MKGLVVAGVCLLAFVTAGCSGRVPGGPSEAVTAGGAALVGVVPNSAASNTAPQVLPWACLIASGSQTGFLAIDGAVCPTARRVWQPLAERLPAVAPGAPGNLQASVSGSTVTLSWVAAASSDPATSYVIEAGSSTGRTDIANLDTGGTAVSLTVTAVPAGTYFVRVRARNSAGASAPSNEVMITVSGGGPAPCSGIPEAPVGLTASVAGGRVTLTWNAPRGVCPSSTYRIEAGTLPAQSNLADFSTGSAATTYSAPAPPVGLYYIRVRAVNGSAIGPVSDDAILIIGTVPLNTVPQLVGNQIRLFGSWRMIYVRGVADYYYCFNTNRKGSFGLEPNFVPIDFIDWNPAGWTMGFVEDVPGLPVATILSLSAFDANSYVVTVQRVEPTDPDFVFGLVRLP